MEECSLSNYLYCKNCINQPLFPCPLIGAGKSDPGNMAESRVSFYTFVLEISYGGAYA